ncbi:polysaccharide deacetylase family protein [Mucilaginibacter sp. dw_454]|uniref:polysaccharide deacetylase family protein n=1 Tax=Mucilaginibacter sp. dw_454 TaxID=2720079 RepID=UPI001BD414F1|nr:polysaccharide deacetylase family protein [Mucilaginibacter sp. dw_454]
MLNFRRLNILFISLLLISIAAQLKYATPYYIYIILLIAYSLFLFYGCYYIGSNFFIRVICSAQTNSKVVALSFDDGPDAKNTPQILQTLKDNHIQAAFFCIGRRIAQNEALLKQIDDEGHLIGNHTFSHHFWFDMFSAKKMMDDMQLMDAAMHNVIGKNPRLFRPPYGVTNPNLKKAIINGNYIPVGWSVRSMDTVIKDESKLLNKLKRKIKPGAIFLLHDTSNATVSMLPVLIKYIQSNGYEIIRLDKMLNLQPYA